MYSYLIVRILRILLRVIPYLSFSKSYTITNFDFLFPYFEALDSASEEIETGG